MLLKDNKGDVAICVAAWKGRCWGSDPSSKPLIKYWYDCTKYCIFSQIWQETLINPGIKIQYARTANLQLHDIVLTWAPMGYFLKGSVSRAFRLPFYSWFEPIWAGLRGAPGRQGLICLNGGSYICQRVKQWVKQPPLHMVCKPDLGWWPCGDYRRLNPNHQARPKH